MKNFSVAGDLIGVFDTENSCGSSGGVTWWIILIIIIIVILVVIGITMLILKTQWLRAKLLPYRDRGNRPEDAVAMNMKAKSAAN